MRRYQRLLQRWLRVLGCEPAFAEDHAQVALLTGLQQRLDGQPTPQVSRWLRNTARELFWARLRQQQRTPQESGLDTIETAWRAAKADQDGGDAALAALRTCLDAADPRERTLLLARDATQASRAMVDAAKGLGEPDVRSAIRRSRSRLRQAMEQQLDPTAGRDEASAEAARDAVMGVLLDELTEVFAPVDLAAAVLQRRGGGPASGAPVHAAPAPNRRSGSLGVLLGILAVVATAIWWLTRG